MRRSIEILCIKDPHVVRFTDNHLTKEGEANSLRQMTQRVLSKRIEVVVDGKKHSVPTHVVKSVGAWALNRNEQAPEPDEFDELLERQQLPDDDKKAVWFKAREAFIAKSIEARKEAEAQLEKQLGGDVAKGIQQMVRNIATGTTAKQEVKRG